MFKVFMTASTGRFHATFSTLEDVQSMVNMVASGAQVSQGWGITVQDDYTGGEVMANGRSVLGMRDAVASLLIVLGEFTKPPLQPGAGIDVVVPVRLAMHDGQLVDAEDFVRGAVERALQTTGDDYEHPRGTYGPSFSYNGDTVTQGSAKEDR